MKKNAKKRFRGKKEKKRKLLNLFQKNEDSKGLNKIINNSLRILDEEKIKYNDKEFSFNNNLGDNKSIIGDNNDAQNEIKEDSKIIGNNVGEKKLI